MKQMQIPVSASAETNMASELGVFFSSPNQRFIDDF